MANAMTTTQQTNSLQAINMPNLMGRYIAYLDASPRTIESYSKNVGRYLAWLQAEGIEQPQRPDLIQYRDHLRAEYKPATVNAYITAVRLFHGWLASEGLYPDIASNLKGAKTSAKQAKDHLTGAQVRAVMEQIDRGTEAGARDYAMLALMFTGGLRTIEISRALQGDMGTQGNKTILRVRGKGRDEADQIIVLTSNTERLIREWLKRAPAIGPQAPIFQSLSNNNRGGAMTTRAISGTAKGYMQAAGYDSDRLTAHSTRHTAVTLALLGGATLQEAQQFARHANIATTQIYAHNLSALENPSGNYIEQMMTG